MQQLGPSADWQVGATLRQQADLNGKQVDFIAAVRYASALGPGGRRMPDGYAFELNIAEKMRWLGWTCEMTPGSGDFGADLFCRVGDEFIIIQCNAMRKPLLSASEPFRKSAPL